MTLYKVTLQATDDPKRVHVLAFNGDSIGQVAEAAMKRLQDSVMEFCGHTYTVAYITKLESGASEH